MVLNFGFFFFLLATTYDVDDTTYVTQIPLLMAHDCAMAYAPYGKGKEKGGHCYHYKTQAFKESNSFMKLPGQVNSGFTAMLNCGARAFDLRLGRNEACSMKGIGEVCMHHSFLWIKNQTFESELPSIIEWGKRNPKELILLKLVPDEDDDRPAIQAALDANHIETIPCPGGVVPNVWTLGYAKSRANLNNGIMVFAVWDECVNDNYIPELAFDPDDSDGSFSALWDYANKIVSNASVAGKNFEEVQLMWQSSVTWEYYQKAYPENAYDEQPYRYGNLKSTQESGINGKVVGVIDSLHGPNLNWVKFNDICLHGMDVASKLGTKITTENRDMCILACGGLNTENTCVKHQVFYFAATTSEENMTYTWIWVLLDLMLSAIMVIFGYFGYNYYQKYSQSTIPYMSHDDVEFLTSAVE